MPVAIPFFVIALSRKDYADLLNKTDTDGRAVALARLDPAIEFQDLATTVVVGHDYRAMVSKHTPFRRFIKMASLTQAMEFATDALKTLIQTRIDAARDGCREVFNPLTFREPQQPEVDPKASGPASAGAILKASPGIAVGRSHGDPKSADFLTDLMNDDASPVTMMFIEEFRIEAQQELDDYLAGPNEAAMGPALKQRVTELKSSFNVDWEPILFKAKQKKIKLYGIDTNEAEPGVESTDPRYGERRVAVMNTMALDVVKKAQVANPGAKFVLMCGDAHLNTHPGGVPGLAQMVGIPGMHVNAKGQLRVAPDDTSLRGMPNAVTQKFIDEGAAAATATYTRIPEGERAPKKLDNNHVRRVMETLAKTFIGEAALGRAQDVAPALADRRTISAIAAMCESTKRRDARSLVMETAIKAGSADVVRRLVAEDPDIVHQSNNSKATLLHVAATEEQNAIVEILLGAGANPNKQNDQGVSPLHIVSQSGSPSAVQAMLDRHGDLHAPDPDCKTGYDHIVARKDPTVLTALLADDVGNIRDLFVRVFEEKARTEYDESGFDPALHEKFDAGELRKIAVARFTALAALTRVVEASDVAEVLNVDEVSDDAIIDLIKRTKARKQQRVTMQAAIDGGDADTAKAILLSDAMFGTLELDQNRTALSLAATKGQNGVMLGLLGAGADANHVNSVGRTTLHELGSLQIGKGDIARQENVSESAGILMDVGADPNLRNGRGQTALHLAGFRNNVSFVDALAEKGADATIKDNRGWTAYDTTLGSTNKEAEAAFLTHRLAAKEAPVEAGTHSSVDLLCMATLSNDPLHDELKTRKMYEKLYAEPSMRPILDLAAAASCNDRGPPKGGLRIFTNNSTTVGPLFGATIGPSGAYDEKVNSLLIGTQVAPGEKEPAGTLAHELTHLTAHLVTDDEDTCPFIGGKQKGDYLKAIAADVNRLHLLSDNDEAQKFTKDRIGGRMDTYGAKKGTEVDFVEADKRLLQEFIVGVPQLIASFGIDYVREQAPALTAYFEAFAQQAKDVLANDPRFAKGRAAIDPGKNAALAQRLVAEGAGPRPPQKEMIAKTKNDFTVDRIIEKVRAEYIAGYGRQKAPDPGGRTVAFSGADFEIKPEERVAVEKKLVLLKKVLTTTMRPEQLPREIGSDALKPLLKTLGGLVHDSANEKDLLKFAALTSDTWTKQAKIDYVQHRVEAKNSVATEDLAEAVVLKAELAARKLMTGGDDSLAASAFDINQTKHLKLVSDLAQELGKPGNAEYLKKPGDLLRILPLAVANPVTGAILVKTQPKRIGRHDPRHVSVEPAIAKREWVRALQAMPLH